MPIETTRYSKDARYVVVLDDGEDYTKWVDSGSAGGTIASSTTHITGSKGVSFEKTAGGPATTIIKTLSSIGINLGMFASEGQIAYSIYLPSLTNVTKTNFYFIEDLSNLTWFSTLVADLSVGWNHIKIPCHTYTTQTGTGVNWNSVKKIAVGVSFSDNSNTMSGIIFDSARVVIPNFTANFDGATVTSSGETVIKDSAAADQLNIVTEDAAHSAEVKGVPVMGVVDTTPSLAAGTYTPFYTDTFGNLRTVPFSSVHTNVSLFNDTTTSGLNIVSEDGPHVTGVRGIVPFAVRNDALTALAGTSGDYIPFMTDADGAIYTKPKGGASAGGGNFTYVSPIDFAATYSSASGIVITGINYTPVTEQFVSVTKFDVNGLSTDYSPSSNAFGFTWLTTSGLLNIGGSSLASNDKGYRVTLYGPDKAYSNADNTTRITEIEPLSLQVAEDSLVDTTNVTLGDNYYPSTDGLAMAGYKDFAISGKLLDADGFITLAVEATIDEDATAANRDWTNMHGYAHGGYGTTVSGISSATTATNFHWDFDELNTKYVRVKCTPTTSTNTVIIKARRKAL